jgi:metallo-beta-lactamase family protein
VATTRSNFENLFAVRKGSDSVRLRDVKEPMLVIAGSGMCTGGRIVGHLKELLPRSSTTVVFVGYQSIGTAGHAIQFAHNWRTTIWLDGEDVPIRARIETLNGLSAHADRSELLRWLRAIPGAQRVALNHGEPDAQRGFAEWAGSSVGEVA